VVRRRDGGESVPGRVTVADLRPPGVRPDPGAVADLDGEDRRFAKAAAREPLGVVEVGSAGGLTRRLAPGRLFPDAAVVVVTPKLAGAARLALQAAGMLSAKAHRPGGRFLVTTFRSLPKVTRRSRSVLAVVQAERATDAVLDAARRGKR
jgi:hypothetical protein